MVMFLWGVLLLICIVAELLTSVSLVTIWFIPGAIVALILAAYNVLIEIQILTFIGLSIVCFIITRFLAKKYKKTIFRTNSDMLIGKQGVLQEDCNIDQNSSVKFGDVVWTVKLENEPKLSKGTLVEVVKIQGNTLIVKKVNK